MKQLKYEDGVPCKEHKACYAHKTKPCEGCGRINMQTKKLRVSFYFDGTLNDHFFGDENPQKDGVKKLFKELCESDEYDVYIITRRFGPEDAEKGLKDEHTTVMNLLETLNIELPEEKILFTNRKYKFSFINKLEIDIHLDDDIKEHQLIRKFSSGSSVDVQQPDWRKEFDGLL